MKKSVVLNEVERQIWYSNIHKLEVNKKKQNVDNPLVVLKVKCWPLETNSAINSVLIIMFSSIVLPNSKSIYPKRQKKRLIPRHLINAE